jgi:hypothetical protein
MNLAFRKPRFPATMEKYYADVLLPDGTVLLIYLGTVVLFGVRLARLSAELFLPNGQVRRGSATVGGIRGGENHLTFGSAAIDGDLLSFETPELSGVLKYSSRFAPCELRRPFLSAEGRSLTWSVEVPDADVSGVIGWPGGSMEIHGRGYRDRVWFDLLPWRFPIRRLVWGRAVAGDHAATWVRASTPAGIVSEAWLDGEMVSGADTRLVPASVALGPSRAFLDADLADLKTLRLGWLRGIVNAMGAGLHETKYRASCLVHGVPGVAVHEVVRWPTLA